MQLAGDTHWLAAGGQDLEVCALPQQRLTQRGAGCQHVLAVVEDEERVAWAEVIDERRDWICAGRERDRDDPCHSLGDQRRVGYRGELDEPGAIDIGPGDAFGDCERQPRLAQHHPRRVA